MTVLPVSSSLPRVERTASAPAARVEAGDQAVSFEGTMNAAASEQSGAAENIDFHHQSSRSAELKPLQRFESFVLRSFIENMLPSENSSFFGTGTAGNIWRSMLAERIGDEMAASGGIGIAEMLGKSRDVDPKTNTAINETK
ncbi:rod-binding protein [Aureimonas sp. ME7]|uniref:rod-binding protein n=1 Tax=Aureimonas sp. ME7 TaxID=2744252 RepID=UPI0015F4D25D|nr:rod-binding protein [Aureimonas sp. ME7]